ncbi:hypothetical protein NHQ30_005279 [Ciborinia camelliae]|nr:hypothetical protein NHQ30_005279 [Ciborinia camelliae]
MTNNNIQEFILDYESQSLEQADLKSPVFPVAEHETLQDQDPSFMLFGDMLGEMPDFNTQANGDMANVTQENHTQANGDMANVTQENHTQAELLFPPSADNATVNPQILTQDFIDNPFPTPVGLVDPTANIMQPSQWFPAPFEFPNTYQHDVLNAFPDSSYPLHIIDSFGQLPPNVLEALRHGVKRQREYDDQLEQIFADANINIDPLLVDPPLEQPPAKKRRVSKTKSVATSVAEGAGAQELSDSEPEPKTPPESPVRPKKVPGKKWIKPNLNTQGLNKRSKNIQSLNPSEFYAPLAQRPQSWGHPNRAGVVPFQYTKEGELNPHFRLTVEQMKEFIFNHPGHTTTGHRNTKRSGLTLWIQSVPSDSAARYPHQNSDKCRFVDCPVRNGTIHKGHYRVAFDEQSSDPVVTDPFHNAGHVHLYCLEKFLDFPFICANFNVQPDDRILPEGRNKMAITRDHVEMKKIVKRFVRNAERNRSDQDMIDVIDNSYEDTLSYKLTLKHLELEPANRQSVRDRRPNANSMDKHMNNLDLFVAGNTQRKQGAQPQAGVSRKKRKAVEIEVDSEQDADFEIDETILDADNDTIVVDTQGQAESSTKRSKDKRPAKRRKRRSTKKVVDSDSFESSSSSDNSSSDSDASDWAPARNTRSGRNSRSSRCMLQHYSKLPRPKSKDLSPPPLAFVGVLARITGNKEVEADSGSFVLREQQDKEEEVFFGCHGSKKKRVFIGYSFRAENISCYDSENVHVF